jgi:O-antigen ligase
VTQPTTVQLEQVSGFGLTPMIDRLAAILLAGLLLGLLFTDPATGGHALAVPVLVWVAVAIGSLLAMAGPPRPQRTVLDLPIVVMGILLALSWVAAPERGPAPVAQWAFLALVFVAARLMQRPVTRRVTLALALAIASMLLLYVAAYSLLAGVWERPAIYPAVGGWGSFPEIGLLALCVTPVLVGVIGEVGPARLKVASGVLSAIAAGALLMSYSRAAWLSFAVAFVAMGILSLAAGHNRRTALRLAVMIGLLSVVAVSLPLPRHYLSSMLAREGNVAAGTRMTVWQQSADLFTDRWLTGWGPGGFRQVYLDRYGSRPDLAMSDGGHAHNAVLHAAVETGIVGALALIWFYAALLAAAVRGAVRSNLHLRERALAMGLSGATVGYIVRMQFDVFDPAGPASRPLVMIAVLLGAVAATAAMSGTSSTATASRLAGR